MAERVGQSDPRPRAVWISVCVPETVVSLANTRVLRESESLEVAGLFVELEWTGSDSALFKIIRHSLSLCPRRQIGLISFHYSDTEQVPVRLHGTLTEDLLEDAATIRAIAETILRAATLPAGTPYDAHIAAPKLQVGIITETGKDGQCIRI